MPSTLSEVGIYNRALDLLEEEVALDPNDDRASVRWLKRNYGPERDSLLRRHPWNFALTRASLAAEATPPAFGWSKAYRLPADCIRLLPISLGGRVNGIPVNHEVEGSVILTDASAPLRIRYIRRVADPTQFDPLFADLLATTLAWRMAHWMTGKQSFQQRLEPILRDMRADATLMDALEGTPEEPVEADWVTARY